MNTKTKIMIVYIFTFILIMSNIPIFKETTIIEYLLMNIGINEFHSNGETGFYYPTIAMLVIGVCLWIFLLKLAPKSKFSKDYFYYCFGMMFLGAIVNNVN